MSPSLTTFLLEAANFVLLACLLSWLFFKPVRKALDSRRAEERRAAEEAASKLAAAAELRQETTRERENLATELGKMRAASLLEARNEADAMLKEAQARMDREREQFKRELETIREAQADRLGDAVGAATREIILRFMRQTDAPSIDSVLLDEACRQLETLDKKSLSPVTVESAGALDADSRSALQKALGRTDVGIEFRVVDELVAGVRILTGRGLIDASWAGLADYAKRVVVAELRDRASGVANDG